MNEELKLFQLFDSTERLDQIEASLAKLKADIEQLTSISKEIAESISRSQEHWEQCKAEIRRIKRQLGVDDDE